MIASVAHWILSLHGWEALVVVFALPALEASAFVGFLFPGEISVLLGGVLANEGRVSVTAVIFAAVAGAIIGDTIGYFVGRRFGRRLLTGTIGRLPLVRRHLDRHLDGAQAYIRRRGAASVFFGRFTAALRVLVPGLAGMSEMPYGEFLLYNAAGGALWGTGFVLLGYSAGAAWHHAAGVASRVGVALLVLVVLGLVATRLFRDRERHSARLRAFAARVFESRPIAWIRRRFPRQVAWLRRRLDPRSPTGFPLTFVVAVGTLCAWVFGALTQDVVAREEAVRLDPHVERFVLDHRVGWATGLMRTVTWLGSSALLVPMGVAIAAWFLARRRDWKPGAMLLAAWGGTYLLYEAVKPAVGRLRPAVPLRLVDATGWAFPSGHAAQAVAFWGMVAIVLTARRSTRARVLAAVLAVLVALVVGASRLYLGVHWFTDVVGGYALGGTWLSLLAALLLSARARSGSAGETARVTSPDRTDPRLGAPYAADG